MDPGSIGTARLVRTARRGFQRCAIAACVLLFAVSVPLRAYALPGLSIADVALAEGSDGSTTFEFHVVLDAPAPVGGVRFDIATVDGSADGADYYVPATAAPEIPEGATDYAYTVLVNGDRDYEPDETFHVEVSNVVGADVVDGRATGTLLNDETTPQVIPRNASVFEGDAGETLARVEIALEYPAPVEVRIDYATADGSARADEDYVPASGTLVLSPGDTSATIDIAIRGDTEDERNESFEVVLGYDIGGPGGGVAEVVILTDDAGLYGIQPSTLPDGTLGERYDQGFYLDGRPGAGFEITAGLLPPGIEKIVASYNGRTYLVGVPTTMGSYTFEVTAFSDATLDFPLARRTYTIVIGGNPLILPPTTLPTAAFGDPYDATLNPATGALPPYRYALSGGALPPGLSLSESGRITGESSGSGTFAFTVTVSDSSPGAAQTASREYTLQALPPTITIEPPFHSMDGTEGQPHSVQFGVRGIGTEPYAFTVTGGALPPGLALTPGGEIAGVPSEAGDFIFTLTITDSTVSLPATASAEFTIRIAPSPLSFGPPSLPDAIIETPYEQRFTISGDAAYYLFQISEGALPPGIDLHDDTLTGVPTEAGTYPFAITVTDPLANSYTRRYTLVVAQTPFVFEPVAPQQIIAGRAHAQPLIVHGGVRPYRFEIAGGALPTGLSINADGLIAGTPTAAGSFHALVSATDSAGAPVTVRQDVNIAVALPGVTIFTDRLQPAALGARYASTLTADGGQSPYTFVLAGGALPAGLELRSEGEIIGTPQEAGSFVIAIAAHDSSAPFGPIVGTREFTLVVEPPRLALSPGVLPTAIEGSAYSARIVAANGVAPYRFEVTAGALPAGLALSPEGVIAGVPMPTDGSGVAQYDFTIGASDAEGRTIIALYRITATRSVAVTAPEAVPEVDSRSIDAFAGATTVVDLTEGARGGPFAAATLVSLTPVGAGSARIEGEGGRYRLHFLAAPAFSGRVEATFTLANTTATSAPARVVFAVVSRPDPTRDARVGRLLDTQVRIAHRFADTQIGNFRQRLERLHGAREPVGFSNGLRASYTQSCTREVGALPGSACVRPAMPRAPDARRADDPQPLFGLWAAGTVRAANHDGRNAASGLAFETDGVSFGADYRVRDTVAFGLGIGYGRDGGLLDDARTASDSPLRGDGEALTVALYASLRPGQRSFFDLLYGEQTLTFDLRRAEGVSTRRSGTQRFASIAAGAEFAHGDWRFAPYARIDAARATFAPYAESGAAAQALAYDALRVDHSGANAGLRIDYRHEAEWGAFAPQLRMEYRREFDADGIQRLRYADAVSGVDYTDRIDGYGRDRLRLDLALRFEARHDWSFGFDAHAEADGDGRRETGVALRVQKRF